MSVINNCFKVTALALICNAAVNADTIYKVVDENGKTSYSTTPPANSNDSTIVNIAPPPSDKYIEAAKARHKTNMETAEQLDKNRQTRNELIEQENRQKRENQKQNQQRQDAETNNSNNDYGYPYIPGRRPLPGRPPARPPSAPPSRPIVLPIR